MERTHQWILVVDDDDDVREMLLIVLELRGYYGLGARDGLEALERLRCSSCPPCVIILDLRMPRLDGLAFLTELRREVSFAKVPVIVVSGDTANIEVARKQDGCVVMRKPVDLEALVERVAHVARSETRAATDRSRS